MLNISDRQSRGGSTGGGGGIVPPTFGYNKQGCLTAVGNRCGHKKNMWACPPPPPPPPPRSTCLYKTRQPTKPNVSDRQHMPIRTCLSDRQHMLTKPMYQRGSTCLQNPCIREAAHAYKTQHIRQA